MPGTPTSVSELRRAGRAAPARRRRGRYRARARGRRARPGLVGECPRRTASEPRRASQTGIGLAFPFASTGVGAPVVDRLARRAVRRLVDDDAVHGRGALQPSGGVDDVARGHPLARVGRASSETSASPVVIPTRSSSPSSTAKSRIASAARTARSGSSSCAVGAPKSAMTASPMNFSTVPPRRSSSAADAVVVGREERLDVLGIHRLRPRGEADEVAEDDRDDLALAPRCDPGHG